MLNPPPTCLSPGCDRKPDSFGLCKKHLSRRRRQIEKGKTTWQRLEQRGLAIRIKKNKALFDPDPESWTCPECGPLKRGQFFVWPEKRKAGAVRCACKKCHAERKARLKRKDPMAFLRKRWKHDCAHKERLGKSVPREYSPRYGAPKLVGVYALGFKFDIFDRALTDPRIPVERAAIDWAILMASVSKTLLFRKKYRTCPKFRSYVKTRVKKYKHANPEKRIGWSRSRLKRTREQSDGTVTASTVGALIEQGRSCFYCGKLIGTEERSVDHVVSIAEGGAHSVSNIVIACKPCNIRKNKASVWRFIASLPHGRQHKVKCNLKRKFGLSENQNEFMFKFF